MSASKDLHDWSDALEKSVLVLNYTMACPLSCSFCCYGCHPNRKEKMPLEEAKRLVTEAAQLDCFSSVGFTGGEVFLFEDELLSLAQHLLSVGLPFTVATAAHWAADKCHADKIASTLANYGLRRANISYDDAHAEFVNRQCIVNAALAFSRERIPVYVVGTFEYPDNQLAEMFPELMGTPFIKLILKQIAKVGRARKREIDSDQFSTHQMTCYRRIHHDIVVFWDGKVYPCCSTFNRSTKGLCVGNAFREPLISIWNRVESSPLFRIMKRQGFSRLYEVAREYAGSKADDTLPPLDAFPGPCSLCNAVFSSPDAIDLIDTVMAEYQTDEMARVQKKLSQLLGEQTAQTFSRLFASE